MSKALIFCADGTWDNTANNTNVFKISNAIQQIPGAQIVKYDSGVGATGLPIEKLTGGAFGLGLYQKIKDGYSFFASHYESGDDLFIYGFSRGAYTARSIGGMICACGLPTKNPDTHLVDTAFDAYRNKDHRDTILSTLGAYGMEKAKIKMIGVWDTVGSLGIPSLFGGVSPLLYGFLDTGLHPNVLNACHAVSIDERRKEFPATLWTSDPAPGQTIEQVWFSGCHGDVGGGNSPGSADQGTLLSDITFAWMLSKTRALGLKLNDSVVSKYSDIDARYALDAIHDPWNVLWLFPKHRDIGASSSLGNSVAIRIEHDSSYHPKNLSISGGTPAGSYDIVRVVPDPPSA